MSQETMQLLALILYNDYLLFPSNEEREGRVECKRPWFRDEVPRDEVPDPEFQDSTRFLYQIMTNGQQENPIERAKRLGTYRKIDRSKQYEGRYSSEALLKSDNHLWARLRMLEKRRLRNGVILAVFSAGLAHVHELVLLVLHALR